MEWIYDRTQSDVDLVNRLNERYRNREITQDEMVLWQSNLKGALNASDLNRIESNCKTISKLVGIGIRTKTWETTDIPRASDFARIRNNIQRIRNAWYSNPTTPDTPELPLNYYQKINDIEKILYDVFDTYSHTVDYCGEFWAGEELATI